MDMFGMMAWIFLMPTMVLAISATIRLRKLEKQLQEAGVIKD